MVYGMVTGMVPYHTIPYRMITTTVKYQQASTHKSQLHLTHSSRRIICVGTDRVGITFYYYHINFGLVKITMYITQTLFSSLVSNIA